MEDIGLISTLILLIRLRVQNNNVMLLVFRMKTGIVFI